MEDIEYNFYVEICCARCWTWISFNIKGYEYPVEAYNFPDFDCQGGDFVSEPVVEIEYEFDDYYDNYAYKLLDVIDGLTVADETKANFVKQVLSKK